MDINAVKAYAARLRATRELGEALALCNVRRARTVREKSNTELNTVYTPWGRGLFFCLHNKMYFHACTSCKRSVAEGNTNRDNFLAKHGISV